MDSCIWGKKLLDFWDIIWFVDFTSHIWLTDNSVYIELSIYTPDFSYSYIYIIF